MLKLGRYPLKKIQSSHLKSRHFFDKKNAENFAWPRALRDSGLVCWGGKHTVGFGWRKFGLQRWRTLFQDLPIYNKIISLQQRRGKKPPPTKTRKRNKLGINSQAGGRGGGGKCWKLIERSKGASAWKSVVCENIRFSSLFAAGDEKRMFSQARKSALKNNIVRNALNSDWMEIR